MNYRPLGRTGLTVSEIGFGCGSVGGLMVRGRPEEQRRAVARALELGITYFDTAPSYGDGRSEENLGRVLRDLSAHPELSRRMSAVVIGTKFRLAPEELADTPRAIRTSLEASLHRLGREQLDLLQLHNNVTVESGSRQGALSIGEVLGPVLAGLKAAQAAGLVRSFGFTGMGETEAVQHLIASGSFDTVQSYFNALNPSAGYGFKPAGGVQDFEHIIDRAAMAGMGVLIIRALAAGALSAQEERHPLASPTPGLALSTGADYQSDLERARALVPLAEELGMEGVAELALRFAMSISGPSTVLVGFSDVAQVEAAVRWAERGPLDDSAMSRVLLLARD